MSSNNEDAWKSFIVQLEGEKRDLEAKLNEALNYYNMYTLVLESNTTLEAITEHQSKTIEEKQRKIEEFDSQVQEERFKNQNLQVQIDSLRKELQSKNEIIQELSELQTRTQNALENCQPNSHSQAPQKEDFPLQNDDFNKQKEYEELQQKFEAKSKEVLQLQSKNNLVTKMFETYKQKGIEDTKNNQLKISELEKTIKTFENENKQLSSQIFELKEELAKKQVINIEIPVEKEEKQVIEEYNKHIEENEDNNSHLITDFQIQLKNLEVSKNQEISELSSQLSNYIRQITEEKDISTSLQQSISEYKLQISSLNENYLALNERFNRVSNDNETLENDKKNLFESAQVLNIKFQEVLNTNIELQQQNVNLNNEFSQLKVQFNEVINQRNLAIQNENNQQNNQQNNVDNQLIIIEKEKRINELNEEISLLKKENNSHIEKENSLLLERDQLEKERNSLRSELVSQTERHIQSKNTLEAEKTEIQTKLISQMQNSVLQLKNFQTQQSTIEQQIEELSNVLLEMKGEFSQIQSLRNENANLNSSIENEVKSHNQTKRSIDELRKKVELSKDIACDLQLMIIELTNQRVQSQHEANELRQEVENLKVQLEEEKRNFEKEKNSIIFELLRHQYDPSSPAGGPLSVNFSIENPSPRNSKIVPTH